MMRHGTQHSRRLADPILLSRCCCLQTSENLQSAMRADALSCCHPAAGCSADCCVTLFCHTLKRLCHSTELLLLAQQPLLSMLDRQLLSPGPELAARP